MSPAMKYTLGRIGLFLAVLLAVWPTPLDTLVKLLVALVASFALSWFLLRTWRDEMSASMAAAVDRRRAQREKLRSALAGEDEEPPEEAGGTRPDGNGGSRPDGNGGTRPDGAANPPER